MTHEFSTQHLSSKDIAPGHTPTYHPYVPQTSEVYKNHKYHPYISKEQVEIDFQDLINAINPNGYRVIMVVEKAGWGLTDILLSNPAFKGKTIISIEYHGNSHSTEERKKVPVPEEFKDVEDALVVDTILDEGGTAKLIEEDCPNANFIFGYRKRNVENQYIPEKSAWAGEIDNVWVFGTRTDVGTTPYNHPKNYGRDYDGIAVMAVHKPDNHI